MTIVKNVLFWFFSTLLLLFILFLTASLLFLFYPEAFRNISGNTSDEICPVGQFPCSDSFINGTTKVIICMDRLYHCDGNPECPNGEDELNCADHTGSIGILFKRIHEKLKSGSKPNNDSTPRHCTFEMYWKGQCSCNLSAEKIVFCQNHGLTEIPDNLSLIMFKLVLDNNTITRINGTVLAQYPELHTLNLDNNQISELEPFQFSGLKKLKNLSLKGNRLRVISSDHFTGLQQLKQMYLDYNIISDFDLSSLAGAPSLTLLFIGHNQFNVDGQYFPLLKNLSWLELDNNLITHIDGLLFKNLPELKTLHMRYNRVEYISSLAFNNNILLQELDLSENELRDLKVDTFQGLHKLNKLDLKHNKMRSLPRLMFHNLSSLESLDLRGITIENIDLEHFSSCHRLEHLQFDKFRYCSYAPRVRLCRPITDGLSSAEHLLVLPVLRYSVWIVALITCVGNIVVLVWRSLSKKEDLVLSLFIKNLSGADLLMGIYLCAIGAHDLAFRDNYRRHALSWMSSWGCTICGFLAMLSSQVSVFTLALITIERYRCITANFRVVTILAAKVNLAIVWLMASILALYPVAHWSTTGDRVFYASNGLCFPLHIDEPYMAGWQYSALVFLGINFPAVLLIITLYFGMFYIIRRDRKSARPVFLGRKSEDAILALRFFGIVVTDCLCWIPIVIIKILALAQTPISSNVYAWVVVFVLPINSALNPIIYTLAAPTGIRRRIMKWCQQTGHNILVKCSFITNGKTEQNSISHTSITGVTDVKSSTGSAQSIPLAIHSSHSRNAISVNNIRL